MIFISFWPPVRKIVAGVDIIQVLCVKNTPIFVIRNILWVADMCGRKSQVVSWRVVDEEEFIDRRFKSMDDCGKGLVTIRFLLL